MPVCCHWAGLLSIPLSLCSSVPPSRWCKWCSLVPLRQFALKKRVSEAAAAAAVETGLGLGWLCCFALDFEGDDVNDGDVGSGRRRRRLRCQRAQHCWVLYNRCWRRRRRWLLVLCVVVTFCFEPIKRFVFVPQIHLACATHSFG